MREKHADNKKQIAKEENKQFTALCWTCMLDLNAIQL